MPATPLASTAGRVEKGKKIDWVECTSAGLNVLACMIFTSSAGPAPHEASHWLASRMLAISGSSVLGSSMRWILANSWCYPRCCRRPWTLKERAYSICTCSLPLPHCALEIAPKGVSSYAKRAPPPSSPRFCLWPFFPCFSTCPTEHRRSDIYILCDHSTSNHTIFLSLHILRMRKEGSCTGLEKKTKDELSICSSRNDSIYTECMIHVMPTWGPIGSLLRSHFRWLSVLSLALMPVASYYRNYFLVPIMDKRVM